MMLCNTINPIEDEEFPVASLIVLGALPEGGNLVRGSTGAGKSMFLKQFTAADLLMPYAALHTAYTTINHRLFNDIPLKTTKLEVIL